MVLQFAFVTNVSLFFAMLKVWICVIIILKFVSCSRGTVKTETINPRLLNRFVNRTIYFENQLVNIRYEILLENNGNTSVAGFVLPVEPLLQERLVYIEANRVDNFFTTKLRVVETNIENATGSMWFVYFKRLLESRDSVLIKALAVFARCLVPLPAYIIQNQPQLVTFEASHYFYSPYCTDKQMTVIKLPSEHVENFTVNEPTKLYRNSLTYGPYNGISAFNVSDMFIHFEYNSPMLTVRNLQRVVNISPWGNIAVVDKVRIQNTGAVLKGPFTRYLYEMLVDKDVHPSAPRIITALPKNVSEIYYRDEIGYVYTIQSKETDDSVILFLTFRYPLFGGWNISFFIGYNMPLIDHLYSAEGHYFMLVLPFVERLYPGMFIDTMETTIVLPEGSTFIELKTYLPLEVDQDKRYLFLDTTGRVAISYSMNNVTDKHIHDLKLYFEYPKEIMLLRPFLLVISIIFLLFATYIIIKYTYVLEVLAPDTEDVNTTNGNTSEHSSEGHTQRRQQLLKKCNRRKSSH